MKYSPCAIKRRQILGSLYEKCAPVTDLPIYLQENTGDPIGKADETLGRYADAFLFHLPEDICKKLTVSHYNYDIDYTVLEQDAETNEIKLIQLNHITLIQKLRA